MELRRSESRLSHDDIVSAPMPSSTHRNLMLTWRSKEELARLAFWLMRKATCFSRLLCLSSCPWTCRVFCPCPCLCLWHLCYCLCRWCCLTPAPAGDLPFVVSSSFCCSGELEAGLVARVGGLTPRLSDCDQSTRLSMASMVPLP